MLRRLDPVIIDLLTTRRRELSDDEALEYDSEEEFEGESEAEEATEDLVAPPVLFEREEEEEEEKETGRREPEDIGRLEEAPAAPVLIENDALEEEVVGFGVADIGAASDNFTNDEGYVSGSNWTNYAPEEEIEMINAPISSNSSDSSDSEYVPEENVMIINDVPVNHVHRPRRQVRRV